MTLMDVIQRGGPVVLILLLMSVVALAIVLERWLHFLRMGRVSARQEQQIPQALHDGSLEQLFRRGPEAAIIRNLLQASRDGITDLTRVAVRTGSQELQRMQTRLPVLGFIGNTAPLLGLLGTITGMIQAFRVIEQAGGKVDAQALAGGIWEAMITTGVGLAVAIPVLFLLHGLEGMAERRALVMQRCASLLIERLPHALPATTTTTGVAHGVTTGGTEEISRQPEDVCCGV